MSFRSIKTGVLNKGVNELSSRISRVIRYLLMELSKQLSYLYLHTT